MYSDRWKFERKSKIAEQLRGKKKLAGKSDRVVYAGNELARIMLIKELKREFPNHKISRLHYEEVKRNFRKIQNHQRKGGNIPIERNMCTSCFPV